MRFYLLTAVASFVAVALAQVDTSSLPDCSKACVGNSIAQSGCGSIDASCICHNSTLISGLACCVSKTCQQADIDKTIQFADNICKPFKVNLPTSASCTSSASSTGTSKSGSSSATHSSTTGSSSSSASTSASAASASSSESSTSASAASQSTGAAATIGVGLGAAMVGVLAML
ncbi:hypothetical protein NA57DRAFT_76003 [Rhizodiscina lignyota]|uniref:CFEM domain-containing protein n=1 Tax=Rhizodiscina lignyota TaxID=1504668 RepID=A0A9P4IGH9_9PEZI|nr:hypothetical protein NA57DRAFT_76003 [Rhizodiscina lignyota]